MTYEKGNNENLRCVICVTCATIDEIILTEIDAKNAENRQFQIVMKIHLNWEQFWLYVSVWRALQKIFSNQNNWWSATKYKPRALAKEKQMECVQGTSESASRPCLDSQTRILVTYWLWGYLKEKVGFLDNHQTWRAFDAFHSFNLI